MTIFEFAEEAKKRGFNLGSNPVRTIRYYIHTGLLKRPVVKQIGKKRVSSFDAAHLSTLELIDYYKKRGLSLKEIKNKISEQLYWSDEALKFIARYKDEFPESAFLKNEPIKREELAFFLSKYLEGIKRGSIDENLINQAFLDKDGNIADFPLKD
ncbi:MAG: MerR family transcriptional regulator [Armatimonadetes bacterium]|nr:MerR family transcriptional regulator [Armatimonadota bacterium]